MILKVGRNPSNDIVINNSNVSSVHAQFILSDDEIILEDLESTNGTYVNGEKISRTNVKKPDKINFSKQYQFDWNLLEKYISNKPAATLTPESPSEKRLQTKIIRTKNDIFIGRTKENDLVIDNIKVSRKHAKLEKVGDEWFIEDLDSSNGTFINGNKIVREKVYENDVITIGGIPLNLERLFTGEKQIKGDIQLSADKLSFRIPGKTIVDEIGLNIQPGEFVGLIGPSGAGKTTLMMMLNGVVRPSDGDVFINSQSLYSNFDSFKGQIGYVPQDDIIHRELKVGESLTYTGKLRLDNYSSSDIDSQVQNVLSTLSIEETKDTLIGSAEKKGISGGQRKRVNLGQELLTEPSILFLDEPTSGLDPKTDLDVMNLLKGISKKGKIVILTTHNITKENFEILTHLIVLTKGGKLAYFGKANMAVSYFDVEKPYEIFEKLETKPADFWKEKYLSSPEYNQHIANRQSSKLITKIGGSGKSTQRKTDFKQFFTLTSRYFKVKLRDRVSTLILLLQAPIIAGLIALVFSKPEEKTQALFVLVIAAIWLGCSNAAREIVSEQAIFKRERMVNLKIPSYLLSKVTVLMMLCVIQCFVLAGMVVPALEMESSVIDMFFLLLFSSLPALALGLLVSSLVNTTEAAMGLIPLVLIPQVILGGLISKFLDMSDFIKVLAGVNGSRWSFEAAMITEFEGRQDQLIYAIGFDPENLFVDISVLFLFSVIYFLLTAYSLKRKDIK